jgi:hypothetical protein
MSNKIKETRRKIKRKVDAIKRVQDNAKEDLKDFLDKYENKALTGANDLQKQLSDFASNKLKKVEQGANRAGDVFSDLINTVEGFLNGKGLKVEPTDTIFTKQRLRQITNESANETLKVSMQILLESAQKILFAGDGICGTNKSFDIDSIVIKPQEIDLLNILTVDPASCSGKVIYENTNLSTGKVPVNKNLYDTFSTGTGTFTTVTGGTLFNYTWDTNTQSYTFTGLAAQKVTSFFKDYYGSIEPVNFSGITKNAIYLTLNGCGDEPPLFDKGWNDLNRLLQKLCAFCGNPKNGKIPNATTEFNENDEDIESYFNFEDVEGIDLDSEKDRLDKVLRFRDCNNYKIPINPTHFEDFANDDGDLNSAVNDALLNTALDAHNQSNGAIPPDNFHLTILNTFILNLPKALIGSLLTPKYLLPIILVYKAVVLGGAQIVKTAKEVMKVFWRLFNDVITKLLWKFITEFWKRVKRDLMVFLVDIASRILKNKTKRFRRMLLSLIALLTKILEDGIGNCKDLYDLINKAIDLALSGIGGGFASMGISAFLLPFFLQKPGYSEDRAAINSVEEMEKEGIDTGPVFGEPSKLLKFAKAIISGHIKEMDENGFVAASNLPTIIPHPNPLVGAIVVPQGIITVGGGNG